MGVDQTVDQTTQVPCFNINNLALLDWQDHIFY